MAEQVTISKQQLPPYLDFYALRKEGIAWLQSFGSRYWTDYNVHDPGVTILEHLCYALTELGYKTNEEGIAWAANSSSFFSPAEIFSTHPVTITDFRKLVLDRFRDNADRAGGAIDNIWIEPVMDDSLPGVGLYRVFVQLEPDLYYNHADFDAIEKRILLFLNNNRNTGEFFMEVAVLKPCEVLLDAVIELEPDSDEAVVAAEIDFALEKIFSGKIEPAALYQLQKQGYTNEDIFEGPLLVNGFLKEESFKEKKSCLAVSSLYKEITGINGVNRIIKFSASVENRPVAHEITIPADRVLLLKRNTGDIGTTGVQLVKRKTNVVVNDIAFKKHAKRLREKEKRSYRISREINKEQPDIKNIPRPPEEYYSIQNDFPANYGIGKASISDWSPGRQANIRQLKAFLLLFEQLIADYQAQLTATGDLLSPSITQSRKSYFFQPITTIKGLEQIIDSEEYAKTLATIYEQADNYLERQNKILDHLLARFGQDFQDDAYNSLSVYFDPVTIKRKLLLAKTCLLESMPLLTSSRMRAPLYFTTDPYHNSKVGLSALYKKINLLAGIQCTAPADIAAIYDEHNIRPPEITSLPGTEGLLAVEEQRLSSLKNHENYFATFDYQENTKTKAPDIGISQELLQSPSFLREGASFENYFYHHREYETHGHFDLWYKDPEQKKFYFIRRFREFPTLLYELKTLTWFLRSLNIRAESFCLVEHILLLDRKAKKNYEAEWLDANGRVIETHTFSVPFTELSKSIDQLQKSGQPVVYEVVNPQTRIPLGFYAAVTMVLPAWTARFADREFRKIFIKIIQQHFPAHLYVKLAWLDFADYLAFEKLYSPWADAFINGDNAGNQQKGPELAAFLFKK